LSPKIISLAVAEAIWLGRRAKHLHSGPGYSAYESARANASLIAIAMLRCNEI